MNSIRRASRQLEQLESRRVLASYQPGDANLDLRVDESDFVQVFQEGRYDQDIAANWTQGDWDGGVGHDGPSKGDGRFNATDLVEVLVANRYLAGPYAEASGAAVNRLGALTAETSDSGVTVSIDVESGIIVARSETPLTTLHLSSSEGVFEAGTQQNASLFDVATSASLFRLNPRGETSFEMGRLRPDLLSSGVEASTLLPHLLSDLKVQGSRLGGGELGDVGLELCHGCDVPDTSITDTLPDFSAEVTLERDADLPRLVVDPSSGRVVLRSTRPLAIVEVQSTLAWSSNEVHDLHHEFDVATSTRRFAVRYAGAREIDLGRVTGKGLSIEEIAEKLTVNARFHGGEQVKHVVVETCGDCAESAGPEYGPELTGELVTLFYDAANGRMRAATDLELTRLTFTSSAGIFVGEATPALRGILDHASETEIRKVDRTGTSSVAFGPVAELGLTEAMLVEDLTFEAERADGQSVTSLEIVVCNDCLFFTDDGGAARPGDSNSDLFFDEADFIQAFKSGKFETNSDASWQEGDWAGAGQIAASDGRFTTVDLVAAFQVGAYRFGVDQDGASPLHTRRPLVPYGQTDIQVHYTAANGSIRIEGSETLVSTFHLYSEEGYFTGNASVVSQFDVSNQHSLFVVVPGGQASWTFDAAMRPGLSLEQLVTDLTVDGSRLTGGGLGAVGIHCDDCATEEPQTPSGDFSMNGELDVADVDLLCSQIHHGSNLGFYDLTGDDLVNHDDLDVLIHDRIGTTFGDSNLDGKFDSSDLVKIFAENHFGELSQSGGWAHGDWNCDGSFDSRDLILAFQDGSYLS